MAAAAEDQRLVETAAVVGCMCWIREGESRESGPFQLGEIVQKDGPDLYQIKLPNDKNKIVKKSLTELLGANEVRAEKMMDLTKLMYIHEAAVSDVLRQRYKRALIYTNVGAMLLVVNPFKDLGLTTTARVLEYRKMPKSEVMSVTTEPHIFAVCAKSVHIFNEPGSDVNLSFVISGESGAGKTESTKHILSFFTTPADGSNTKDPISEAIMAGNPILEAFGNAMTLRNNNSSRFGRLIKLYTRIDEHEGIPVPVLLGGDVTPYLLEKSRITHAAEKERNYHVFYQVCKGIPPERLESELMLPRDWKKLSYLKRTLTFDVPNAKEDHDEREMADMEDSFRKIKLTESEIQSCLRLVAAVLHIGEIVVKARGDTEMTDPESMEPVDKAVKMLGLAEDAEGVGFYACSTQKYFVLPGDTKETASPLKVADAQNSLHSTARTVYEKLFLWFIKKINEAVMVSDASRWAAVLDIFGFEIMAVNSLEQLLINYANERLQQFFIENVFAAEKEEYSNEGIDPSCVVYEDNMALITVIDNEKTKSAEGKPLALGLMKQLNSSCMSGSGTDATFLSDCKKAGYDASLFEQGQGKNANDQFILVHSMARVAYTITNFREKNNEKVQDKSVRMMRSSSDKVLVACFTDDEGGGGGGGFTAQQFKASINSLLDVLQSSTPFFIRCLKPNQTKIPGDYDFKATVTQLASLSILDALTLSQKGYPQRDEYETFLERNKTLCLVVYPHGSTPQETCVDLLKRVGDITPNDYKEGTTKLFLRKSTYRMLDARMQAISRCGDSICADLVRLTTQSRTARKYEAAKERAVKIQAYGRGFSERLVISKRERRKRSLWGITAWAFKLFRFRKDRLAAMTIQCTIREIRQMHIMNELVKQKRSSAAIENLYLYLRCITAQTTLQAAVERMHNQRVFQVVRKLTEKWIEREELRRFWTWRGLSIPAKRLFKQRLKKIIIVQAHVRGKLARKSDRGVQVAKAMKTARSEVMRQNACLAVQRHAKGWLRFMRIHLLWDAAETAQFHTAGREVRQEFCWHRRCVVKIQAQYRAWLVRSVIIWHKLRVLYQADLAVVNKLTTNIMRRSARLVGAKPLSAVAIQCLLDIRAFYPEGWLRSFQDMLKIDGVRKICIGAEHTVSFGNNGIYTWGSDEVGQLGIGGLGGSKETANVSRDRPEGTQAPTYGLVAPVLRAKVLDIACGRWHTIAHVFGSEPVFCWGLNHRGQCGAKHFTPGSAFTATYPKMVRTPETTVPSLVAPVQQISAGPFTSGAICGEAGMGFAYIWGSGEGCGQARDVRVPMRIGSETVHEIQLGDGYGIIVGDYGASSWGTRCSQLGIGADPKRTTKTSNGLLAVRENVRFDVTHVASKTKLVPVPVPIRMPRIGVAQIAVGERHVVARTQDDQVFEWGVRIVVRTDPLEPWERADLGLVHLSLPAKVDVADAVKELRAAGQMTIAFVQGLNSPIAWSFVQTSPKRDIFVSAPMQFRHLRNCSRLEASGSESLVVVLGANPQWPELKVEADEPLSPSPPRGSHQPVSPRSPKAKMPGVLLPAEDKPGVRQPAQAARSSFGTPLSPQRNVSPGPSASRSVSPGRSVSPQRSARSGGMKSPMRSPGRSPLRSPHRRKDVHFLADEDEDGQLSPPFDRQFVPEYGSVSPTRSPPRSPLMKRPIFQSPNFRAGNTPRFVNDDAYDAVAARRGVAGIPPGPGGVRSRSPSPSRPLSGRVGERVEDLTTRMPIDVTAGEASETIGADSKNRTLFEIQHMLRGRSAEDLVAIKRILRGTQED